MPSIVIVADPLEGLRPEHDSTVALMEEAQRRGHQLWVTTAARLGVRGGAAVACCTPVEVTRVEPVPEGSVARPDWWRVTGEPRAFPLADADAVFMRVDPPFDEAYLRATYLLDRVDPSRTLVVNAPAGLREANEKLFALRFPEFIPETVVSADPAELAEVTREWGRAVLKPTDAMAGRGVLLLRPDDANLRSLLETATDHGRRHVIAQAWVAPGGEDHRVVVVDGEPVGVVRRVAAAGEFRCNLATGARAEAAPVTPEIRKICDALAPHLRSLGILLAGLDLIGDRLIEVNVTSPTGFREIEALSGARPAAAVLDLVERAGQ
jgi:glutathione synthase